MKPSWLPVLLGCAIGLSVAHPIPAQVPAQDNPVLLDTPYAPAGYARLLQKYVVKLDSTQGGFESRFDYIRFWETTDQDRIRDDIRSRFLSVDPDALDPSTLSAWAVNAYNFLIIDLVMENLVAGGELKSIADIGKGEFSVFDQERFEIAGKSYSLNRFEHHFLFGDVDRESGRIPRDLDPRFHFALVCAAKGCPPLWPEPLDPQILDRQLAAMTRNALRSPRQLRALGNTIHVSQIFAWYEVDFQRVGMRAFLETYAPEDVAAMLAGASKKVVADIEWDWSLNRP